MLIKALFLNVNPPTDTFFVIVTGINPNYKINHIYIIKNLTNYLNHGELKRLQQGKI